MRPTTSAFCLVYHRSLLFFTKRKVESVKKKVDSIDHFLNNFLVSCPRASQVFSSLELHHILTIFVCDVWLR